MDQITDHVLQEAANEAASSGVLNERPKLVVKLSGPFMWDGEEITQIDLSGLYDMTADDMLRIDDLMFRSGYTGQNPEITRRYALLTAAHINKRPYEFCGRLKARDAVIIKNLVSGFFYSKG